MSPPPGPAIHLDTSFLIRALVAGSTESNMLRGWLEMRRPIAVSAFAWGEFLCGPPVQLDEADRAAARRIAYEHLPVRTKEVTEAARLFNHGGRRRGSFPDCIIAGTAMVAGAALATSNPSDFEFFADTELMLAE